MQGCSKFVAQLVIFPEVFSRGQYLQCFWLQNLKPRLAGSEPRRWLLGLGGTSVGGLVLVRGLLMLRKSVIDLWTVLGMGVFSMVCWGVHSVGVYVGSAR